MVVTVNRKRRMDCSAMEPGAAPAIGLRATMHVRIIRIGRAAWNSGEVTLLVIIAMTIVMIPMVMLVNLRFLPASAAVAAETMVLVIILIAGQVGSIHHAVIPDYTLGEADRSPVHQELELVDVADQCCLAVHVRIARPARGFVVHTGTIENIVAQQVVFHDDGNGALGLEQFGIDRHLLRNSDLIEAQCSQCDMTLPGDMIDRFPKTFADFLNKSQAADRSFRFQYQIPLCRTIGSEHNFELQNSTSFLLWWTSHD